ncbi:MAG TPA: hypothetical protein VGK67_02950 [Myxococcales bacterium]|jgi:hypothetical protein
MTRLLAIAAAVLMLASPAQAAPLPQLRAEVAQADGKVASVRGQRLELQKSLDLVARQIEELKAAKSGKLFGNAELDDLLKKSQAISSQMTDALKLENEAEEVLRGGQAMMVNELDSELARLRARWDAAKTREERSGLVGQLKALRAERDSLRRAMPSTMVPRVSDRPTDDPEELLERADALLDAEDKLRREEQALSKRIEELKAERDLERRMNEFMSEDSLFDEHDRRFSVTRSGATGAAQLDDSKTSPTQGNAKTSNEATPSVSSPFEATSGYNGNPSDGRTTPPAMADTTNGEGGWTPGAGGTPIGGGSTPGRQDGASAVAAPRIDVTKAPPERRTSVAPYSEDEGLDELLGRRVQIQKVAEEMRRKADEAAKKAKSLQ